MRNKSKNKQLINTRVLWSISGIIAIGVMLLVGFAFAGGITANNNNISPKCTVTINGENVAGNAVQSAINSAKSGAVICLDAAVYPEQLVINKPLTLIGVGYNLNNPSFVNNFNLEGVAAIQPTTLTQTATD